MSRFIRTSLSMATISLASFQAAGADDTFIVQPRLQQTTNQPAGNSPVSNETNPKSSLVVQPTKSGQSAWPASNSTTQTSSNKSTSLNRSLSTITDPELQSTAALNGSNRQPDAQVLKHTSVFPQTQNDSWQDPNGLTWVKRGSIETTKAAETVRMKNENNDMRSGESVNKSRSVTLPEVRSIQPATSLPLAVQDQSDLPQQPGQATASAFSLAKASSSTAPVWLDNNATTAVVVRNNVSSSHDENQTQVNEGRSKRLHLASAISKQLLADQAEPTKQLVLNGTSMSGPVAVEQQLTAQMARSEQLCRRGMFLSAREESFAAMIQLSRYLDSLSNTLHSEPCLRAAKTAMREAEDFSELMPLSSLRELAGSHETPVLKGVDLSRVPPASLAQLYYQYAESKLLEGSQQHPWFSDVFYSVGRSFQAEADGQAEIGATPLRLQAVVYYRASTTIRPKNSLAANQLGFVLLQMDRPREAQLALVASVDSKMDQPALQNLAEASRRLGDQRMHQWAMNMIVTLQKQTQNFNQQPAPQVIEVDNRTFGQTTPIVPTGSNNTPAQTAGNTRASLR